MEIVSVRLDDFVERGEQYKQQDVSLVQSVQVSRAFGRPEDYVEYSIYGPNGDLLLTNYFVNSYKPVNPDPANNLYSNLLIDPEADAKREGFTRGEVSITYNFYRKLLQSDLTQQFWIGEISSDRTEIRVYRQDLSNDELQQAFNDYNLQASVKAYYPDFYLNFGDDDLRIGVNMLYVFQEDEGSLLIKLYEPLPENRNVKDRFWLVDKLGNSTTYVVTIDVAAEVEIEKFPLRGPNYNVSIVERIGQTTPVYNLANLFQTGVSASYQQLKSLMEEKGLDINVDYSNFENFVHYSSAAQRITNFAYKVTLIESYQADIDALGGVGPSAVGIISSSRTVLQNNINSVIEKFDGYEYYLYFESGSSTWPKSSNTKPYSLYSVTSSEVINWLGDAETLPSPGTASIIYTASNYDATNKDWIKSVIPEYLREDPANVPYVSFYNMVGQHFDNIWIYLKDVTERFNAENSIVKGISKDIVGEALKGLGINLYTNTSISDSVYYSLLGINEDGSILPPTGSERNIQYVITSSVEGIPAEDITLEYYKRIYHNLPYLLKTKGTERGIRALINCFGLPSTILRINEFGGSDKLEATPDLVQTRHTLAYYNSGSTNLALPWVPQDYYNVSASNTSILPDTVEFRFKSVGIPTGSYVSQSVFEVNYGGTTQFGVGLVYDPAIAIPSSSYENYGYLTFYLNGGAGYAKTSPIFAPFFDEDVWWSVMLKKEVGGLAGQNNSANNTYWVYAKSAVYAEEGNGEIGFEASRSMVVNGATSASYNATWNYISTGSYSDMFRAYLGGADNGNLISANGIRFQGYFQEFRYWGSPLSESAFDEHVIDSLSYKGNTPTASLFDLTFRLPLGANLNVPYLGTGSIALNAKDYDLYELGLTTIDSNSVLTSYHPAITGAFYLPFNGQTVNSIASFVSGSTTFSYGLFGSNNQKLFTPFEVVDLVPTPSTGVSQKVNNKVSIPDVNELSASLLSPFTSLQIPNTYYNKNSADIEVGFSPSDNLDEDIAAQLGYFNIDEYIGNPADAYEKTYQDLDQLRTTYFQKYISKYNVEDYIRLIKFFDNSLFKMLKDFVPARASLTTGIIVKPHILERSKYERHEPVASKDDNYSGSIEILEVTGTNPEAQNLNTTYTQSIMSPSGAIAMYQSDLREPFTGEFSGSELQGASGYFPQTDVSSITAPWTSSVQGTASMFTTYSLDPLLNNASTILRSNYHLEPDYTSNAIIPVNLGLITGALALYESRSRIPAYTGLDSEYWPFADVSDYNYQTYARLNPRYSGSKTISSTYTVYTDGDQSYGKTAAIDKEKLKYAYLLDIYTASAFFPGRSNAQIKYLIDNDENTLNLTKANFNLFDVQNIFKSGETVDIALFEYDEENSYSQLLANNPTLQIYEGGWRYLPILHNLTGSSTISQRYTVNPAISITIPAGLVGTVPTLTDVDFRVAASGSGLSRGEGEWRISMYASASFAPGVGPFTFTVSTTINFTWYLFDGTPLLTTSQNFTIPSGSTSSGTWAFIGVEFAYNFDTPDSPVAPGTPPYATINPPISNVIITGNAGGGTSTGTVTYFTTEVTSSQPCLYILTSSNQVVFNNIIAEYYQNYNLTFNSTSDPGWNNSTLERVVLPFSLSTGDRISFFDSASALGWDERFEYTVKSTSITGSGTGSRLLADLDRPLNLASFTSQSGVNIDSTTGANFKACRYVVWKHVPDETNVIVRYDPKDSTITEEGLLYPQYLTDPVKQNAGNVVQSLKANNLI